MKTEKQMASAAQEFAARWAGRGYEKGDSQVFWTELLIEQKSIGMDLRKGILQSDGSLLNPFQQAKRHVVKTLAGSLCVAEFFKLYQELTK